MAGVTILPGREPAIARDLIERWAKVPVTIISDVLGGKGLLTSEIRPLIVPGEKVGLAGLACTASCASPDFGAVLYAFDCIQPGEVLVIAAAGDGRIAYIGEVLVGGLRQKKVAGLVCDGAVRDVSGLAGLDDFPVYARSTTAHGPLAGETGTVNAVVSVDGVAISPGDLIIGDEDGVICLTPEIAADNIAAAEAKVDVEAEWIRRLGEGESLQSLFGLPDAIRK